MRGKRKESDGEVHGAPDIAHPSDEERYERQLALIYAWFFEMWERMRLNDHRPGQPGHEARLELQTLLLITIGQVLGVARSKKNSPAKKWAHELLAIIFVSIGKHVGKVGIKKPYGFLMGKSAAFREMKKKLGKLRTDVLFAVGVAAITRRELRQAERYRKTLLLLKAGCVSEPEHKHREALGVESSTWKQAAKRQKIPEAYWFLADLPEFSAKEKPFEQWWEALWPFIEKKINVSKMPRLVQLDRNIGGVKSRKRYPSDSQKTAQDHLKTLAELKDKGVYY